MTTFIQIKEYTLLDPSDLVFGVDLRDRTIHISTCSEMLSAVAESGNDEAVFC